MTHKTVLSILAAITLSVFAPSAIAQQGQWAFGIPGDDEIASRITLMSNGDLLSCGHRMVTRQDGTTSVIDWMTTVHGFLPYDVIETSTGRIIAAGAYVDDNNNVSTMLVMYNPFGGVMLTHVYPGWHIWEMCDLIETNSGGFMIVGEILETTTGTTQPFIIKTDQVGNEIWMNRYDAVDFQIEMGEFTYVQEEVDADGTARYHLTGRLRDEQFSSYETLLMTIDENGAVLKVSTIGFDNHTDFGRGLTRVANNQFLVTGFSKEIGEGGGTYLMRTEDDFTVLWYYGIFGFSGTKEIVLDSVGSAILAGIVSFPNPIQNAALIAVDSGSPGLVWGMQYGGQNQEWGRDFTVDTGGGYALLGTTRSFGGVDQDQYLVRTDVNGESGCNEMVYRPEIIPNQVIATPIQMEPVLIAPIPQFSVPGGDIEYFETPLCEDPDPCVCVDPPLGMVGWWTLDEPVGPVAADSVAGNDGTYVSNPIPSPGKVANCLEFDGIDDYVSVPDDPLLDVGMFTDGDFTIDAWIWLDATNAVEWGPIVDKIELGIGYEFFVRDDSLGLYLADPLMQAFLTSSNPVPHNEWVHVAAIVDRTGSSRFLINGVEELAIGVPPPMSYENAGSFLIGKMRGSPPQYFDGKIDEVEFFNRALDTSEIQAIYNAQECGKCKIDCHPPWDVPFCNDEISIIVAIPVCNYSPIGANIELSFAGLSPPTCGNIDGPTNFTVISPGNPIFVPGNQCVTVMVLIKRPVQMTSLNDVSCYEVTITNLDNGQVQTCSGSVQDRRDLCPGTPDPDDPVELPVGAIVEVTIPITNTAYEGNVINWRAVAYGPNMAVSDIISLNGGQPGTAASGKLETAQGETSNLRLDVQALAFQFGYIDLVIFTEVDGQVTPLTSRMMETIIGEDCLGDFNGNGVVDGGDLGLLLSAWGKCGGCPEDLNGSGVVDGGDIGLLLAAFGACP
jgi:hypothetical protein